jgi:predicted permease
MRSWIVRLRYAFRQLLAARTFTIAAVLTLALGIGGTTAIFTLIHAVMLRSLPVGDPASLYRVGDSSTCCIQGGPQDNWGMFSGPLFERLKAATPEFDQIAAFQAAGGWRMSIRRQGSDRTPKALRTEYVSGNYFTTLGVGAFGGRVFSSDDDTPASTPVVVLSHHVWQGEYGSDPAVLGSTLVIGEHPFTVVGIAPAGFFGETLRGDPADVYIPLHQEPLLTGGSSLLNQPIPAWLRVIGRLKPGASVAGMGPRLTGLLRNWMQHEAGYPSNWMPEVLNSLPKQVINVVPAGSGVGTMKAQYQRDLNILLGVCSLVLLIACANVANLLLARAVQRRRQTAIRLALGASRRTLIVNALTESLVLAFLGAAAGLVVAMVAARLLLSLAFSSVQFLPISTMPSPLVVGFATGLAFVTAVVFGAVPAWFATSTDPIEALRGAGRATADGSSFARKALLVVQATLSVVLVTGSMLLARTLDNLESQDFGYNVDNRIVISLLRPPTTYTPDKLNEIYRRAEERLAALPGVHGAGLAIYNPLTDNWGEGILVQGHPPPKPGEPSGASWDRVSANYMQNFGMTMVRGRFFATTDNASSRLVAIVNEAFVKRFFSTSEDPLRMRFGIDLPENAGTFEIVGVVRDAKFAAFRLDQPAQPMFYVPLVQWENYPNPDMHRLELTSHFVGAMMLVTSQPPSAVDPVLRKALAEVDPNLTINTVRTMAQQVALSFDQERSVAGLAALFGAVALILAAIGLYSVTAYSVAQQTNEIGVRMALGADRARVMTLVLRGAFRWVVAGLIVGVPLAIGAGKLVSAQLYRVTFWDPRALGAAAAALGLAALAAALIPAMRAAGIDPVRALRAE